MLPRGDVGPRTDARIVQLHAAADTVTAVTFLPQSMSSLLAGISHRWLRLFDLRSPAASPVTVASKAHGIATDPFDAHRVACFGDNVVTVWDTRRFTQPLLTFTEKDAGADGARLRQNAVLTTVEFSSTRRGMLATLEREASHVRFWDLQQAHIAEGTPEGSRSRSRDSSHSGKGTRLSWANPSSMLPWSASNAVHSTTSTTPGESSPYHLILADTRKTKNFSRILSSFALVPSADPHPLTSNIMVVNREGDLELYSVHDTPKHSPWKHSPPPEPWDILMHPSASVSHPHSLEDQSSPSRGRSTTPPPAFGRGDADGFPALNSPPSRPQANLAATRPGREREREHDRTFSPAVLRHSHFEHTTMSKGAHGRAHVASGTPRAYTLPLNGGSAKVKHAHSRAREAPAGRGRAEIVIQHLVEEDISMVMRKRVIQGYGLVNSLHNSIVAKETSPEEPALSETWLWIHHAQRLLSTPTPILEGYDFSYQGLFGIWEGFRPFLPHIAPPPTPRMPQRSTLFDLSSPLISGLTLESRGSRSNSKHGGRRRSRPPTTQLPEEFLTAIAALNGRSAREQPPWRPSVATARLAQRQFALQLCGWSLAEDDLAVAIKRWERENSHSQAACWLIFLISTNRPWNFSCGVKTSPTT
ncbi:hypothetical protein A0H81_09441 [Grifola frondosa]|uniref:Uncharacterized protein n=1 Tax=Grifola frondosa TaxID=5627 RepID=A0A1C7M1F9_GRIFR|nr:hypothetical protein A0H81_09441 [Grifola frondosa]